MVYACVGLTARSPTGGGLIGCIRVHRHLSILFLYEIFTIAFQHSRLVANDIQFAIGFIAARFGALLKSACLNLLSDVAVLSVASTSPC